jgi:hypothetical protein
MNGMKNEKDHTCKDCNNGCAGCCGCCHGGKHIVLRWILGIIILVAVFCAGLKLGFFAASIGSYGGYGSHYGKYRMMMQPYYFQQMPPAQAPVEY